jgi:hypothetical protein
MRVARFGAIGVLLLYAMAVPTSAATITVTNTNDSGPGSLRQALVTAHDGDSIIFAVTGTIVLTSGGLPVNKNITISGPGADQLSIDGNQGVLVFGVFAGRAAIISGLTARNAQSGILNDGTVAVINCTLSDNSYDGLTNYGMATVSGCVLTENSYDGAYSYQSEATVNNSLITYNSGDGLYNDHGILSVSDCLIDANSYSGISNFNALGPSSSVHRGNDRRDLKKIEGPFPGDVIITNTIVSDNSEHGVYNYSGHVTILNSTLSGNSAGQNNSGGGIYTGGGKLPGNVMVINSTMSGNFAFSDGGGIACGFSGLTVINSTISGNSAGDYGGGIANGSLGLMIVNSTVSGNSAATCGGVCAGTIEIGNTILNANTSGNIDGTVNSHGYNISSDDAGGLLTGPGDQINTDPLLGPLRDHGGPTLTHMPLRGSPAIDAGDPGFTPPPDHDQRGSCFYRVFGSRIDVGSVETQPRPPCVTPAPRPTP